MNTTNEHYNVSFDVENDIPRLTIGKYVNGLLIHIETFLGPQAEIKYKQIKDLIEYNLM